MPTARFTKPSASRRGWTIGRGAEHAYLKDSDGLSMAVEDEQVLDAFEMLTRLEGLCRWKVHMPGLAAESWTLPSRTVAVVNLSGRGDKDVGIVEEHRPMG